MQSKINNNNVFLWGIHLLTCKTLAAVDNHMINGFSLGKDRQTISHISPTSEKQDVHQCQLSSIECICRIMLIDSLLHFWRFSVVIKSQMPLTGLNLGDSFGVGFRQCWWQVWWVKCHHKLMNHVIVCVQNHVCSCRIFRGIQGEPAAPEWWSLWWQKQLSRVRTPLTLHPVSSHGLVEL